jgi:hypothetical protein
MGLPRRGSCGNTATSYEGLIAVPNIVTLNPSAESSGAFLVTWN